MKLELSAVQVKFIKAQMNIAVTQAEAMLKSNSAEILRSHFEIQKMLAKEILKKLGGSENDYVVFRKE